MEWRTIVMSPQVMVSMQTLIYRLRFYFLVLLLVVSGCGGANTASLPATTVTATITRTASPSPTATFTPILTPTPTLTPVPTRMPTRCGGPPSMNILLIGSDARENSYTIGLADAIRLVRVDFVTPGIQVLTFPRDLYVEIPGLEKYNGSTHGKLNQAFLYGNPGYGFFDGYGQGPGLMALTLEQNFGASSDHYLAVNLRTFVAFVDALGGIDVNMPYTLDGRVQGSKDPDRLFKAGSLHLDGYRTMLLARLRPNGDFKRSEIQNLILQAMTKKLSDPLSLPVLINLFATFHDSVQTDIGPVQAGRLFCLAAHLDADNIEFADFPESLFKSARVQDPVLGYTSIVEANFDVIKIFVQKFEDGVGFDKVVDTVNELIR